MAVAAMIGAILLLLGTLLLFLFQRDPTDPGWDFAQKGGKTLGTSRFARFWNGPLAERRGLRFVTRTLPDDEHRAVTSYQEVIAHRVGRALLLTGGTMETIVAVMYVLA